MSYYTDGVELGTLSASGDQNDNQYKFVKAATTEGMFLLADGASGPAPLGVLQNDPKSGDVGRIKVLSGGGVTQLWVDAATAIAFNDYITCGSDGRGVVAETAGSNNHFGIALQAVASGSALIPVLLQPGQVAADNTP